MSEVHRVRLALQADWIILNVKLEQTCH